MRSLGLFILVVLAASCQEVQRPEQPEDLIARDKMVDIYTDLYIHNAARSVNIRVLRSNGIVLDTLIYRKYEIDSSQFVRSNAFYTSDLDNYHAMFEEVEARLMRIKAEYDSIAESKEPNRQRRDSINRMERIERNRRKQLLEAGEATIQVRDSSR